MWWALLNAFILYSKKGGIVMITTNTSAESTLHLRIDTLDELLTTQNFHPHRHRYLQTDWVEWLVQEAADANKETKLTLQIEMQKAGAVSEETLKQMIGYHFEYLQKKATLEKQNTLKQGYKYLGIASLFLLLMTIGYNLLENWAPDNKFANTMQDALVILGWVAFWRPAELLLYDWHPFKNEAKLYERLAAMPVVIKTN
jgi:hypothetical protein